VGNIFSYAVSPKGRFMLTLLQKNMLGDGVYEFVFATDKRFGFKPGQYLEWTLEHKYPDNRGNRRYFTIASAPGEQTVNLGVKFYEPMSTYKRALMAMKEGDILSASHLAGDFTLPADAKRKFVFIAGGIGVTPFRSMVGHMLDTNDTRPTTILYANKTAKEVAYKELFDQAQRQLGTKVVYALSDEPAPVPGHYQGKIDAVLIKKEIPDYAERTFYISGPHSMVESFQKTLGAMGVPRWHIKVDFFPGFA
jgi:ferredoxin-NADP reductase